jgi:hypothetical protein
MFLRTLRGILTHPHPISDTLLPNRLARAIFSVILAIRSDVPTSDNTGFGSRSKRGKKRGRAYEGGEVFKVAREVICSTTEEGDVLLAALNGRINLPLKHRARYLMCLLAIEVVLRNPNLSPALASVTSRLLLSILLALHNCHPPLYRQTYLCMVAF